MGSFEASNGTESNGTEDSSEAAEQTVEPLFETESEGIELCVVQDQIKEDGSKRNDDVSETSIKAMFTIETKMRLLLATSQTIGFFLPLAIAFGDFYDNSEKLLVPIFYAIVIALAPPFQATVVFMFSLFVGGVLPGFGLVTAMVAATVNSGSLVGGYLILVLAIFCFLPLLTGPLAGITKMMALVLYAVCIYAWFSVRTLISTGLVFGAPKSYVENKIDEMFCQKNTT